MTFRKQLMLGLVVVLALVAIMATGCDQTDDGYYGGQYGVFYGDTMGYNDMLTIRCDDSYEILMVNEGQADQIMVILDYTTGQGVAQIEADQIEALMEAVGQKVSVTEWHSKQTGLEHPSTWVKFEFGK